MTNGFNSVRTSPPGNGDDQELDWSGAIQLFETVYMASRNLAVRTREEYKADIVRRQI